MKNKPTVGGNSRVIRNGCGSCGGKKSYVSLYVLPYSSAHRRKRSVSRGIKATTTA